MSNGKRLPCLLIVLLHTSQYRPTAHIEYLHESIFPASDDQLPIFPELPTPGGILESRYRLDDLAGLWGIDEHAG